MTIYECIKIESTFKVSPLFVIFQTTLTNEGRVL